MIDQCPNGVVCHHCGQPGHRESRCEAKLKDDATEPTTSDDAKRTKPIAAENSVVTSKQETTSSTSGIEDIQFVSHPVSSKAPPVNTKNTEDELLSQLLSVIHI